jgi:ESCRT-II complex subunit VPS25
MYRLQPNPSTLSHQLGLWTTLVLNWARFSRVWEVNTDSPQPGDVFVNKTIGRESLREGVRSTKQKADV